MQARRQTIHVAAQRLFRAFGYDGTSLEDLAAAAHLPSREVRRHFPLKESLLLCEFSDLLVILATAIENRPLDEAPATAALNALLEVQRVQEQHRMEQVGDGRQFAPGSAARAIRELEQPLADLLTQRLIRSDSRVSAAEAAFSAAVHAHLAVSACQGR